MQESSRNPQNFFFFFFRQPPPTVPPWSIIDKFASLSVVLCFEISHGRCGESRAQTCAFTTLFDDSDESRTAYFISLVSVSVPRPSSLLPFLLD